ncbi:MAG: glutamine--scyllo-inositol aminotransferase [candidate division Zixibacteria bacterium SM23_81]|nr:MAG: glutamine--scyllo-inositol aminotransferase [candidate division Zixibacteria bacterium SM23_81]
MIRLARPQIGQEEIKEVSKVLGSGFLVQGKNVEKFETKVAEYLKVKYAIAVSSGTAALHLSLMALGIKEGDEVILPDFTFPATGNVVALVGAKPILVDIDLKTYNIDPTKIEENITPQTKAVIPVHEFGQAADIDSILAIAGKYDLSTIEDAACALGAESKGRKCGTLGDIGCFSFHPRKAITTGEGGMVVTNSKQLAEKARALRNHGMAIKEGRNSFEYAGFNYRMTDFQGAMGWIQIKKLDEIIEKRRALASSYNALLKDLKEIQTPFEKAGNKHIYQSYVVLLNKQIKRDNIIRKLRERGIETTIGTYCLHCQPFYRKNYSYRDGQFKNSSTAFKQSLCLPLHIKLKPVDARKVKDLLLKTICMGM